MRVRKAEGKNPEKNGAGDTALAQPANPAEIFAELCQLLEEFAPSWYTKERHHRARAALRDLRGILEQAWNN